MTLIGKTAKRRSPTITEGGQVAQWQVWPRLRFGNESPCKRKLGGGLHEPSEPVNWLKIHSCGVMYEAFRSAWVTSVKLAPYGSNIVVPPVELGPVRTLDGPLKSPGPKKGTG